MKPLTVLGFPILDEIGSAYHRIIWPFQKMREIFSEDEVLVFWRDRSVNEDILARVLQETDVIVWQLPASEEHITAIEKARKAGITVIVEMDDNIEKCSPFNAAYRNMGMYEVKINGEWLWKNGENGFDTGRNRMRVFCGIECARKASAVTTTEGPFLQEHIRKNYNKSVYPVANSVDVYSMTPCRWPNNTNQTRIGWMLSGSHREDVPILWEIGKRMKKYFERGKARLVMFGHAPDDRTLEIFGDVEYHPGVHCEAFPYKLSELNLDIGIAPLEENEFNASRSCLKILEYGAVGVPVVASDFGPYAGFSHPAVRLCSDIEDWVGELTALVEMNPEYRKYLGLQLRDYVCKNYSREKMARDLKNIYEEVRKNEIRSALAVA